MIGAEGASGIGIGANVAGDMLGLESVKCFRK